AAHSAVMSDNRLPMKVTNPSEVRESLEGRVLGHGEDEQTGRPYMILEGTDCNVHFIWHSREIERARRRRQLDANSFIRLSRNAGRLDVIDFGDAEKILLNKERLRNSAHDLANRGIIPTENGWAGWLGKYEAAIAESFR